MSRRIETDNPHSTDFGKGIVSDFEGFGTELAGGAKTVWEGIESHFPTFNYPSSVLEAIETGIKGVPDDVKSAISSGDDAGKAVFNDVKTDVMKHSTVPSWVHSLPTQVQNAFSTDLAKAKSEAGKAEKTMSDGASSVGGAVKTGGSTTTSSDNAAPRQTHLAAGAAGVFGILGLVAAL